LRLERENQRLERERLQREKEELRRAQEKLEETKRQALLKRAAISPSPPLPSKRHSSSNSSRYEERYAIHILKCLCNFLTLLINYQNDLFLI